MSIRTTASYILWPITIWYGIGVRFRNLLFSLGILKQKAPHITTIGVGNLATGGTGKTPHVEYLLALLSNQYTTAMLSRGYKRKSKGYQLDDGSHDAALLGDEPAMIAARFPNVQIAVCKSRLEGIHRLTEQPPIVDEEPSADTPPQRPTPQVIVLDDVFQHRQIKPSINILLTEYRHPYYHDHILPFGDLREPRSARYRASIVIVTKCPQRLNPIERHNIATDLRLLNYQKIFFSYFKYQPIQNLDGTPADIDLRRTDNLLIVTGIAHPESMIDEIRTYCKVRHIKFPDHHNYTEHDLTRIKNLFDSLPGTRKAILTTEKDAIRLRRLNPPFPILVQPIEVAFHNDNDRNFDQIIESTVRENISFLNKLHIWN